MRELGRQAILPHPRSLSGPAGSYRDAQMFMIWEERNQELWPGLRLGFVASEVVGREYGVALIPFRPGALVENPRCGVSQRCFEIVVTEVLLNDLNVLIRGVGHQKACWEFQCFFRSAKTEDSPRSSQKFVGVDHCSLPCEARLRSR